MASKRRFKIGGAYEHPSYGLFTILEENREYFKIRFERTLSERTVHSGKLYTMEFKDYRAPTVCGVGYVGASPKILRKHPFYRKIRITWTNMIKRCYENTKGYEDVYVCEEWKNFSVFFDWAKDRYVEGFHLDKDIYGTGKLYCPEYCRFVEPFTNQQKTNNRENKIHLFKDIETGATYETRNPSELAKTLGFNRTSLNKLISGSRKKCKNIIYIGEKQYGSIT